MKAESGSAVVPVESYAAADGTALAYRVVGDGPQTVTAIHSLGLDGSWFVPFAEDLGPDYTVVIPDVRGHGGSAPGPFPLNLAQIAGDVITLWDRLGIDTSAVIGISMGGMVAQGVAALAPDRVTALVLIATTRAFDDDARAATFGRATAARAPGGMAAMTPALLPRWFDPADVDPDTPQVARARAQLLEADPMAHASMLEAMTQVGDFDLSTYSGPTAVLAGADDASTPPAVTQALAAAVPGASYLVVPGGHLAAFTHADAVADRVRTILKENL